MQKITTHFWYTKEAKDAAALYVSLFKDSEIANITTIHDTPSGDADTVSFKLAGQHFMAISAGPYFTLNPAVSMFVVCESEEEIKHMWEKLVDGGKVLMEYNTYPWAQKYGWLQDKYGLSWQLSMSENHQTMQKITPLLMFTQDKAGKTKEAIAEYVAIFPDSSVDMLVEYAEGDGDTPGYIKHARFTLSGQNFMAMDSSLQHDFTFNEATSFIVNCETQEEVDYYWEKLSAVPEAEQCGWLKDKFGLSWQIVPTIMNDMMAHGDADKIAKVTKAFLQMKKFNIAALKEAYEG